MGSDKDTLVKGEYAHGFGSNWWVGGGRSGKPPHTYPWRIPWLSRGRVQSEAALGEAMEDGNRNTCWDDSQEAIQMQNCLRKESRQHNLTGWFELRGLIARHPRLRHFAFNGLWSAACYAYRYDSHRFDCYWQEDGHGGWMVFVILQAEHVLNRRGR